MCWCSCEHWTFCNFQMKHGIIGLYPKCMLPLLFLKEKNNNNNNKSLNERPWHQHVYRKTFCIMVVRYTVLGIGHGCKLLTIRAYSLYLMIRFSFILQQCQWRDDAIYKIIGWVLLWLHFYLLYIVSHCAFFSSISLFSAPNTECTI